MQDRNSEHGFEDFAWRPDGLVDAPDPAAYYEPAMPPRNFELPKTPADRAREEISLIEDLMDVTGLPAFEIDEFPTDPLA